MDDDDDEDGDDNDYDDNDYDDHIVLLAEVWTDWWWRRLTQGMQVEFVRGPIGHTNSCLSHQW